MVWGQRVNREFLTHIFFVILRFSGKSFTYQLAIRFNLILINELMDDLHSLIQTNTRIKENENLTWLVKCLSKFSTVFSRQIVFDSKVKGLKGKEHRRDEQTLPREVPATVGSSPVLQCAQVTRPALLVLGLLLLLLRPHVASLPKALFPRRTTVLIPRMIPWWTNGLNLILLWRQR